MIFELFIASIIISNSIILNTCKFHKRLRLYSFLNNEAEARTILSQPEGYGFLSTLSRKKKTFHYPHSSIVGFSSDETGRPFFILSSLSLHTRNLILNNSASLCVTDYGFKNGADARVSLTGNVNVVSNVKDSLNLKDIYKKSHPNADWIYFPDFTIYKMDEIFDINFVGGFNRAASIKINSYYSTKPDPLIFNIQSHIEFLNENYYYFLVNKLILNKHIPEGGQDRPEIKNLDCYGINFRIKTNLKVSIIRLNFKSKVSNFDNLIEKIDKDLF